MKNKEKQIFSLILAIWFFLIYTSLGVADVTLPWSTTYNCADWNKYSDPLNCDGLSKGGSWQCGGGEWELITNSANMAAGGGGKGQRHWEGDGINNNSGGLSVSFSPQKEIWIRWFMRYERGFKWDYLLYDKILYMHTDTNYHIPEFYGSDKLSLGSQAKSPVGATHYCQCSNCGWTTIMGGATSDGLWHCHEVHLKMDTDGTDGVGEWWVDGVLKIQKTDVDFGTRPGWIDFMIGSNQRAPNNGRCMAVDFDDIAISNTGYIGPTYGVSPSPPKNLKLQ